MKKLIITLEALGDADINILKHEFETDILPDYIDVATYSVRVEGGDDNGKEKERH